VIIGSLAGAVPLLMALPIVSGWMLLPILFTGGLLLQSTLPVTVTFAQTIAPVRMATVSSLMMGFGWGLGGVLVPMVGLLGDRFGIAITLALVAGVLPIAAIVALRLPSDVLPSVPSGEVWYDRR
jgi:FSR family fosmidomycin resistance protein-like MFS transporter